MASQARYCLGRRQLGGEPAYATDVVARVAGGDLTVDVKLDGGGRGSLLFAMREMVDSLRQMLGETARGARAVADTSAQIAQGNVDLSQRTEEQASTLEEAASSMEDLTTTVAQNARNAQKASQLAASAAEVRPLHEHYRATRTVYSIDLPGYGFAEAPKPVVERWQALLKAYLAGRPTLRRVFLLVDARHGLKPVDAEIMALLNRAAVTFQVVLTKADKPRGADLAATIEAVKAGLAKEPAAFPEILVTSSETGQGIETLRAIVAGMA